MYYTYILRSQPHPDQIYIGSTHGLRKRLAEHNAGSAIHTNNFKPWDLLGYVALHDRTLAERFERYLKSGSGRAFAARHLPKREHDARKWTARDPRLLGKDGPPALKNVRVAVHVMLFSLGPWPTNHSAGSPAPL